MTCQVEVATWHLPIPVSEMTTYQAGPILPAAAIVRQILLAKQSFSIGVHAFHDCYLAGAAPPQDRVERGKLRFCGTVEVYLGE